MITGIPPYFFFLQMLIIFNCFQDKRFKNERKVRPPKNTFEWFHFEVNFSYKHNMVILLSQFALHSLPPTLVFTSSSMSATLFLPCK